MAKQLTEQDVVRFMREEWNGRIKKLFEEAGVKPTAKVDGEEVTVLTPELKVVHKKSGIMYTVDEVGTGEVLLRKPEGDSMLVDTATLESEYRLE